MQDFPEQASTIGIDRRSAGRADPDFPGSAAMCGHCLLPVTPEAAGSSPVDPANYTQVSYLQASGSSATAGLSRPVAAGSCDQDFFQPVVVHQTITAIGDAALRHFAARDCNRLARNCGSPVSRRPVPELQISWLRARDLDAREKKESTRLRLRTVRKHASTFAIDRPRGGTADPDFPRSAAIGRFVSQLEGLALARAWGFESPLPHTS